MPSGDQNQSTRRPKRDGTKLEVPPGVKLLRTFEGHQGAVLSVAFDPSRQTLASGSDDHTVKLWEPDSGKLLRTLKDHQGGVWSVAFDPSGQTLASGSNDKTVKFWERDSGNLLRTLEGHKGLVRSVAFDPSGQTLASGGGDDTVKLWERGSGKLLRTLEGHTGHIDRVAFSSDGQLLASKSGDGTVRLWRCDTWETVAVILVPSYGEWTPALAFHPTLPLLATSGPPAGTPPDKIPHDQIHLWELDLAVLLGKTPRVTQTLREKTASYAVAKVLLVGDTGVGKTGLAERLVHRHFVPTESTHGRKVHTLEQVEVSGAHGERVQREIVLWDLAGQPGHRLVVFDARSETDPFGGAAYWSQALDQAATNTRIVKLLVAARSDRGGVGLNEDGIQRFVKQHGFAGYLRTSRQSENWWLAARRRLLATVRAGATPAQRILSCPRSVKEAISHQ